MDAPKNNTNIALPAQNNLLPQVSALTVSNSEKSLINSVLTDKRISQIKGPATHNRLVEIVLTIIFERGWGPKEFKTEDEKLAYNNEQKIMVQSVIRDVHNDFADLTLHEVETAFYNGARGNYGPYHGINIITFYDWLRHYKNNVRVKVFDQIKRLPKPPEPEKPQVDKKQLFAEWMAQILTAYDYYVKTNQFTYYDFGNLLFTRMDGAGLINLTKQQYTQVWQRATQIYRQKHSMAKAKTSVQRANFKAVLNALEKGDKKHDEYIDIIAKHVCIEYIFADYKLTGKNLEEDLKKLSLND